MLLLLVIVIAKYAIAEARTVSSELELRQAINENVSIITLSADIDIELSEPIIVKSDLTIEGKAFTLNTKPFYTSSGFDDHCLFIIDDMADFQVNNLRILGNNNVTLFKIMKGNLTLDNGTEIEKAWIAIYSEYNKSTGSITLNNCSIHNRYYSIYPNAMIWLNGNVDLLINEGCKIFDCSNCWIIDAHNCDVVMSGGRIYNNGWRNDHTAGIHVFFIFDGNFEMNRGIIEDTNGSGVGLYKTICTINGGEIINNKGHGIDSQASVVNYNNGVINGNKRGVQLTGNSSMNMKGGEITNNGSIARGGGIYLDACELNVSGGVIKDNKATIEGDDIYITTSEIDLYKPSIIKLDNEDQWFHDNKESRFIDSIRPSVFETSLTNEYQSLSLKSGKAFTVKWKIEGNIVSEETYRALATPVYKGNTPVKPSVVCGHEYVFSKWQPEIVPVTDNITYTANFTKLIVIYYNANGGTGEMESCTVPEGTSFSLPTNRFIPPAGMVFSGWLYENDEYQENDSIIARDGCTVKAKWIKQNKYKENDINLPQTGDNSQLKLWYSLFALSFIVLILKSRI